MRTFLSILTIIGSVIGMLLLIAALAGAVDSAPKQCVLISAAIAFAVLAYCFLKAYMMDYDTNELLKEQISLLKKLVEKS
jgi:hypothetical protein